MIPLNLYSSGFTAGKLTITNNLLMLELMYFNILFVCFVANIIAILLKWKLLFDVMCYILSVIK